MRFASPFQRRSRPWKRARAALSLALGAALSQSCFFELAELEPPPPGGFGGAGGTEIVAGTGGSAGDDDPGGVGGGGTPDPGCDLGFKRCDGACVPESPENGCGRETCERCAPVAQALLGCNTDNGQCQVAECNAGFADCNADTGGYNGNADTVGDGCEYPFGPGGEIVSPVPTQLSVPEKHIDVVDGSRDDWAGIPAYPLLAVCENCVDRTQIDVIALNEVPPRRDLEAYFRVAWDGDHFYVLGDVFDSAIVADGTTNSDGRCQGGALCEDALTLFIDGRNNRAEQPSYSNDDFRLFISTGNKDFRVSGEQMDSSRLDYKATLVGAACYRIETAFAWSAIVQTQPDQSVAGLFPPAIGQSYGFDISVNDWDRPASETDPQRESQLFWISPGEGYESVTAGFGAMTLAGPPTLGSPQASGMPE